MKAWGSDSNTWPSYEHYGKWERTPWWVFWRPPWRRLVWPWDYLADASWQYASATDFLLM
jgi:hypothetical protein